MMDTIRIDATPDERPAAMPFADWLHSWAAAAGLTPAFTRRPHFAEDLAELPARR